MAEKFIIKNGKSPKGTIEVMGAKNATFPVLMASLLTKETCTIDNIPLIEDVFKMLDILKEIGAKISWKTKKKIEISCENVDVSKLPNEIIGCFRGSVLLLGPILARFGKVRIPPPGGCLIGMRPLDTHLDAFKQLGVKISLKDGLYSFKKSGKGDNIILKEFSVTGTENVLLYSAMEEKETILKMADQDYMICELIDVLEKMGVKIKGKGSHTLKITGKKELKGFEHTIMSDPIETGTFICLALASQGDVLIKNAELSFLELFLKRLKDFGAKFEISKDSIRVLPSGTLEMDKVQSLPYPGIHTDLQPELGVLATQAKGPTLIHDPLYDGRLIYIKELNKMGANIIFCDPHRAIVNGPVQLTGIEIPSPDLRAGAALIIAGLVAKGETVIKNIYQIDRGYERLEERLKGLGIDIKRVKD